MPRWARKTIGSPINVVVVERFWSPGEYGSGQLKREAPILKLAQLDPLRVEAYARVSLYEKISVGMQAKVSVDRVIDSASSTFRVRLELPNPNQHLRRPSVQGEICKHRQALRAELVERMARASTAGSSKKNLATFSD